MRRPTLRLDELINLSVLDNIEWITRKGNNAADILHIVDLTQHDNSDIITSNQLLLTDNVNLLKKQLKSDMFNLKTNHISNVVVGLSSHGSLSHSHFDIQNETISIFQFNSSISLMTIIMNSKQVLQNQQIKEMNAVIDNSRELSNAIALNMNQEQLLMTAGRMLDHNIILLNSHFEVVLSTPEIDDTMISITNELRNSSQIDYIDLSDDVKYSYKEHVINIYPLTVSENENKAFLGVLDFDDKNTFHQLLLKSIVSVMSVLKSKTDCQFSNQVEQQNVVYSSMIKEELTSEQIMTQLQQLNINSAVTYQLGLFELPIKNLRLKITLLQKVYQLSQWFIDEYHSNVILIHHEQRVLFVLPSSQNISHFLKALRLLLIQKLNKDEVFYFGYSKTPALFKNISKMYREALEAARLGIAKHQQIIQYRPKYNREVLKLIPEWESQSYLNEIFANIKNQHDVDDLILTLNVYFTHGQSITKVAEVMFIHRNTVIFRLKKIESLLQVNLKDAYDVERIFLGTMLWKLSLD